MVTYRCKDPSDNRPLIIINVTGAGPVPPPSHNNNGPSLMFFALVYFEWLCVTAGSERGGKYDGRTEGRGRHVTPTSLTVELA